ncbi:MAG: hypothetical protein ACPH5G_18115 [Pseudooceanicola atlanticus]
MAQPVQAQTTVYYDSVQDWEITSRPGFFCRATLTRPNGEKLMIAWNADSIMDASVNWPGLQAFDMSHYGLRFWFGFDPSAAEEGEAIPFNIETGEEWLALFQDDLSQDPGHIDGLKNSASLDVMLSGRNLRFPLDGSHAAITKLQECVEGAQSSSAALTGYTLMQAYFDGGRFMRGRGGQWHEQGDNGGEFLFMETSATDDRIFLYDDSRDVRLILDLGANQVYYAGPGEEYRALYTITATE